MKGAFISLAAYYDLLSRREGLSGDKLVSRWTRTDIAAVESDFAAGVENSDLHTSNFTVTKHVSSASLGHRVATFLVRRLGPHLTCFAIHECPGPGYPDRRLVRIRDGRSFAMELKATQHFNVRDPNRVVLTSVSRKLRMSFQKPVRHLLVSASFERVGCKIWIRSLRLDFLQPTTKVKVRLEASTSHYLLGRARHKSIWLPTNGVDAD